MASTAAESPRGADPWHRAFAGDAGHTWRSSVVWVGLLALLTLAMFADVLFAPGDAILSNRNSDLAFQFFPWLSYGFGELAHGHLPLWNPHVFSGAPFLGEFQAGLLYPFNAILLCLPLSRAINWSIALHVFLSGALTYAWAVHRGLRPPACFLAAVVFMFCGAHFLHIYAGHFPHLCTLTWTPLLFLAIDGVLDSASPGWMLAGMFAVAMQALAGFPQFLFCSGVAAAIYCGLCAATGRVRLRSALGLAGIVIGGVLLSAVQLLTSIQELPEMLRGGGLPYDFAATFSFPPENLLTLLTPGFFGDLATHPYWGRWCLWEMCLFIGVTGLVLAVVGAACGDRRLRRFSLVMVLVLLLLALGSYTPLFKPLFLFVPGFNKFRGSCKFILPASLFLAMLAGIGLHELLNGRRIPRILSATILAVALLSLTATGAIHQSALDSSDSSWWRHLALAIQSSGQTPYSKEAYQAPDWIASAGHAASISLLIVGVTLAIAGLLVWFAASRRWPAWTLLVLAVAELFVFARRSVNTFDPQQTVDIHLRQFLDAHPGDYRILNPINPNSALVSGARDIWGYDAGIVLRYAQVVALTQGIDPDQVTQFIVSWRDHPLLGLFRCRYAFSPAPDHPAVYVRTNGLPQLLLVHSCRVSASRDQLFSALMDPAFDPRAEVLLETAPNPAPQPASAPETVRLVDSSSDQLTIEADTPSPAVLLVTDVYARGWRARALPGSSQQHYDVMPADWCLRGIPLAAGNHRLRLEYRPAGFLIGRWISLLTLLIYAPLSIRAARGLLSRIANRKSFI